MDTTYTHVLFCSQFLSINIQRRSVQSNFMKNIGTGSIHSLKLKASFNINIESREACKIICMPNIGIVIIHHQKRKEQKCTPST